MHDLVGDLGGAGEAGAVVNRHQIVVDRLGNAHETLRHAVLLRPLGQCVHGVHGVVAADVEHDFDVVLVHDLHQALEVGVVAALQLVAAGAQSARGRLLQNLDLAAGQLGEVVELVVKHALDAVQTAVDTVVHRVQLVGADDAGEAGVDDGSGAAGLGDEAIGHGAFLISRRCGWAAETACQASCSRVASRNGEFPRTIPL